MSFTNAVDDVCSATHNGFHRGKCSAETPRGGVLTPSPFLVLGYARFVQAAITINLESSDGKLRSRTPPDRENSGVGVGIGQGGPLSHLAT